jgi:cell division protein DivIC
VKIAKIIFSIFSNRYLLATAAFVVWVVFFDESNFFIQRQRQGELNELNKKIEYYKSQVASTKQELSNLQNDPVMLEKYAREKYYMKRANEDVFVFDSSNTVPIIK